MKSLTRLFLQGTLTSGGTSVSVSNDNWGNVASFAGESVVLISADEKTFEMAVATASAGTLTFTKRGLDNSDVKVEVSGNKLEWRAGTKVYISALASDIFDKDSSGAQVITGGINFSGAYNFSGTINSSAISSFDNLTVNNYLKIPSFANSTARDVQYPSPVDGDMAMVAGDLQHYNGTTVQWETADTGTPTPNASPSVAGKVKVGTTMSDADAPGGVYNIEPVSVIKSYIDIASNLAFDNFGDGSDGDVTITTTVTLTKDMNYNNLIITSPGILIPDGYKIYVKGTLSGNGKIQRNGNAGADAVLNAHGAGATALNSGTLQADIGGGNGGDGGLGNTSAGSAGSAGASNNPSYSTINGVAAGAGGAGAYGAGSAGGAGTSTRGSLYNVAQGVFTVIKSFLYPASSVALSSPTSLYKGISGSGGGGGGGGGSLGGINGGGGGGGGGNGGVIFTSANIINWTGTREAIGGKGGNGGSGGAGNPSYTASGGGGGGGGGNGGVVILIYKTLTSEGSYTLTGGAGGTKGLKSTQGSGGADGNDGTTGNAGTSIKMAI